MSSLIIVISLFSSNLFAQKTYVDFHAGYGLGINAQNLNYFDFYNITESPNATTYEQVDVSLGKGLNLGGSFGYMFNEQMGLELGVSYLFGDASKAKHTEVDGATEYTLSSRMLRFNPSFVIASNFEKINPYAKFGFIMGFGSVMYETVDNDNGDIEVEKLKLNGGMALGLTSALGLRYNLNDKMAVYGEFNMINLSYAPTTGEVTEATSNGVNELPDMTTREKEIEFVDSYTGDSPDAQPRKELKQSLPFGSFGLNIGLRINL